MNLKFNETEMKEYLKKLGYSFTVIKFIILDSEINIEIAYKEYPERVELTHIRTNYMVERVFYKEIKKRLLEI